MSTLHAIGNWLYHFFGLNGTGPWYAYHSGPGANWSEYLQLGAALLIVRHLACHEGGPGFFRGCHRFWTHRVEGTSFRACRRHHPLLSKYPKQITAAIMAEAHEAAQAARRADSDTLREIHRHVTAETPTAGRFDPEEPPKR